MKQLLQKFRDAEFPQSVEILARENEIEVELSDDILPCRVLYENYKRFSEQISKEDTEYKTQRRRSAEVLCKNIEQRGEDNCLRYNLKIGEFSEFIVFVSEQSGEILGCFKQRAGYSLPHR